ncbi:MAG: ATP-dependent helicase [Succinivibrio sp.]
MALNDAQQNAVDYVSGPCLVLAGAGSGKTRVITTKIVSLINDHNYLPSSILAVTFTNKAACEMRDRVKAIVGTEVASQITITTFHSLGLTLLKEDFAAAGLSRNFTLFDEYDSTKVIRDLVRENYSQILIDNSEKTVISEIAAEISNWKTNLKKPEDLSVPTVRAQIYSDYQSYLKACNAADFEDLIFKTTLMLRDNDDVRRKWNRRFKYILVDEYQDTNETQYQLLKYLTGENRRFTVVGDDDQSIYAWRGAKPENIKILSEDFPDLRVIKLEQNYRSTQHILNCANKLISHNEHIFNKTLYTKSSIGTKVRIMELRTESDEADRVAELILGHQFRTGKKWHEYAVLYRSNSQSRAIEKSLHEARIPCYINGGTSFFEQVEIKDMLSWCRVICNPYDDNALLRVINIPRRGIGHETINTLFSSSKALGKSLYEIALNPAYTDKLKDKQKKAVTDFVLLLTKLRQYILNDEDLKLADELSELIGYEAYIKANTDSKAVADIKARNVSTLMTWIKDFILGEKSGTAMTFLEAVDKLGLREMMDRKGDSGENDAVQLLTLHASKGLEFPYVYLVGFEEGTLPHKNSQPNEENGTEGSIDEERRLAYVGITRAQQELTILLSRETSPRGGVPSAIQPSRFLKELPLEDIDYYPLGKKVENSREQNMKDIDKVLEMLNDVVR